MMSCFTIKGGMDANYHFKDGKYYTQNMTNHDKWIGSLSTVMGLRGEVTKEEFKAVKDALVESGRGKRVAMDCVFSAPKSVSLAMAESEETREIMRKMHNEAVEKTIKHIEEEYAKTRIKSEGKTHEVKTGNICAAEFEHQVSRNNDLDLHDHVVFFNCTVYNGKMYSVEYGSLMHDQKEVGLVYRQNLAAALQKEGYELELTDKKYGFFELKGFDRETIDKYSSRRQEILEEMENEKATTAKEAQAAAMKTRKAKSKVDIEEVYEKVNHELFVSGKIRIERNERNESRADERDDYQRDWGSDSGLAIESRFRGIGPNEGQGLRTIGDRCGLQDLSERGLDETAKATNLLLSSSAISRLAKLQADRERDAFMQRADSSERRERIDAIASATIKEISTEKFAFTVPEIRQRIMSAGVLEAITRKEAEKAMERAGLVKLGRIEHGEKKTKDVYLTTEENIKREASIIDRMNEGKGKVNSLTQEESEAAFEKLRQKKEAAGIKFTPNREQTIAVHHVLTSADKYLCIQGLAGTGKTYTMTTMRELCEQEGIVILGASPSGKAADGLQNESAINSKTIHSFLGRLEAGQFNENKGIHQLQKAVKEIGYEALPKGYQNLLKETPEPVKREGIEAAKQAVKEIAAEALPGVYKGAAKEALRQADRQARYEENKEKNGIKQEWDFVNVQKVKGREIWVIDEAGMIPDNIMEQLMKAAEARGAQVVLSGDYRQLPPVGAGEPMKAMIEAGAGTAYLEDIRRQDDLQLRGAVVESVKGDPLETYKTLDERGDYHEIANKKERQETVKNIVVEIKLKDYIRTEANGDRKLEQLLLTSTNADRKAYNQLIRNEYVKRGELEKGQEYKVTAKEGDKEVAEKRHFAKGDRIVFLMNDSKMDVKNGTLGTIVKIEHNRFTVQTDKGEQKQFYIDKYNNIDHSYAVTNYKAQGMTIQRMLGDMCTKSKAQDRNALYVNVSRAKDRSVIFTDDKKKLEKQTENFVHKVTSKDFSARIQKMERGNRIENNDCYKAPEKVKPEKLIEQMGKEPQRLTQHKAQEQEKAQKIAQDKAAKIEQQKTMKKESHDMGMSR